VHHSYFHGPDWKATTNRDLFFILFPAWVYMGWLVVGALPLAGAYTLSSGGSSGSISDVSSGNGGGGTAGEDWAVRNGWLLMAATASFSLLQYEVFHSFSHSALPHPLQAAMESCSVLMRIQRRHRLHHTKGQCNFCITWPFADHLFGTVDDNPPP
jgi:hypothetical protein